MKYEYFESCEEADITATGTGFLMKSVQSAQKALGNISDVVTPFTPMMVRHGKASLSRKVWHWQTASLPMMTASMPSDSITRATSRDVRQRGVSLHICRRTSSCWRRWLSGAFRS